MNSLNNIQIIGNMTADPAIKQTPAGKKVASFSVATSSTWKDSSGERQEKVEYHSCVAWGSMAEIIEKYTTKGKKVYVQGRLETRSWEDQGGVKKYKTEIVAESVILLSPKEGGERPAYTVDDEFGPNYKPKSGKPENAGLSVDDIPF